MTIPKIAEPSVKSLYIQMNFNDQELAQGTAFTINTKRGPTLITNRHNVTGRHQHTGNPLHSTGGLPNQITIWHNSKQYLGRWVAKTEPLYEEESPRWREHPLLRDKADFVALPLTQLKDVQIFPYDPSNPGTDILVGMADILSVVGFPFGIRAGGSLAVWATGFMASEPDINYDELPVFLIDCRSRTGQSGSPVIAYRSGGWVATSTGGGVFKDGVYKFLGIYSGRINKESDLGMVWKTSAVKELADSL
ncbi:MAG: serine protease [Thermodesulfobacteriota bacterium]|nr:serine protease [Thermodesulfobacteriota bacterium]